MNNLHEVKEFHFNTSLNLHSMEGLLGACYGVEEILEEKHEAFGTVLPRLDMHSTELSDEKAGRPKRRAIQVRSQFQHPIGVVLKD